MKNRRRLLHSTLTRPLAAAITLTALIAFVGCGDDEKNPAAPGGGVTPTSGFTGLMTNGQQSGKITITVNSTTLAGRLPAHRAGAAEVAASANFTFGGATNMATGVYSEEGDTLNLSGSGYTFAGELDLDGGSGPPSLVGQFDGPGGLGFFGALSNELSPTIYCGKFWNTAMDDSGTFNVAMNDTAFASVFLSAVAPDLASVSGQVSGTGTTRTLSGLEGDMSTFEFSVDGTLNTTTGMMSGTWTYTSYDVPGYGPSDDGTWEASLCP